MKILGLCLAIAACGGPPPKTAPTTPAPAAAARLELPEYPRGLPAGVLGGADLTEMTIATDPVAMVRAFYTKDHLKGFEIIGGEATKESPLRVRDAAGHREYAIVVYEYNGTSMIETKIHVMP